MNKKFKNNSEIGFTLIEMLGAVLIVVILSGVLIASNRGAVTQAVDTKVKAFATSIPITLSGSYIANWKLDQINYPTTNQTPDSWGANVGTLNGATLPVLQTSGCVYNNCLNFSGDDYIDMGNPINFQISTGTAEAWIKTANAGSSYRGIVVKPGAYGMFLKDNIFEIYDWTQGDLTTNINLADNNWHHVLFIFNAGATNGTKLYIDSVLKLTTTMNINSQSNILLLGSGSISAQYFTGYIDDVRLYEDALQIGQIQQNYLAGLKQLLASNQISEEDYASRLDALNQYIAQN